MTVHHRFPSRFAILLMAAATVLFAQEFRGTLTGTVTDPSGASVAKAHVTAVNNATQQTYNSITTAKGAYYIPYVLPGTYTVSVSMPGFKQHVQDNVIVQAGESRGLNFELQLGTQAQMITVTSTPPLLQTANGSGGTVLSQHELANIPLNGRQVYMLLG
ncbi:MAG: carboxypeptidase-like regulatory domain-containing protein, partial [Bryobacteraceae bacterium]